MIDFDGKELREEFNRVFENVYTEVPSDEFPFGVTLTIDQLTSDQLWWLVKFAKHVRGRCRNNAAFNSFMNRNFKPAEFLEVPKEYNGRKFMGLKIITNGESSEGESE